MCGIGGIMTPAGAQFPVGAVQELWTLLEDRGTHASGICFRWTDSDKPVVIKDALPASQMIDNVSKCAGLNTTYAFFHTRYTTTGSTSNNGNNHPIVGHDMIVTHNGVISQHSTIFNQLGVERLHQVDSECINASLKHRSTAWLADNIQGSISIAWVDITQNREEVNLFTNGRNPLVVARLTNGSVVWASTLQHIEFAGFEIEHHFNAQPFKQYKLFRNDEGYVVIDSIIVSDQMCEPYVATMYRHTASYAQDVGYTTKKKKKSKKGRSKAQNQQFYAGMYYDVDEMCWKIAKNRRV